MDVYNTKTGKMTKSKILQKTPGEVSVYMLSGSRGRLGIYPAPKRGTHCLPQPIGQHFSSQLQSRLLVQLSFVTTHGVKILLTGQCAGNKQSHFEKENKSINQTQLIFHLFESIKPAFAAAPVIRPMLAMIDIIIGSVMN